MVLRALISTYGHERVKVFQQKNEKTYFSVFMSISAGYCSSHLHFDFLLNTRNVLCVAQMASEHSLASRLFSLTLSPVTPPYGGARFSEL